MVIGVVLSGIIVGLFAAVGSLLMGAPLWFAIIAYPLAGAFGAIGFIAMTFLRSDAADNRSSRSFVVDYYK